MSISPASVLERIIQTPKVWLFLDYDGTLANFENTPDIIAPDPHLKQILSDLVRQPGMFVAVISGRCIKDLQALLPVTGLWLAGTYGVEWKTPDGKVSIQVDRVNLRPILEKIKKEWRSLIGDQHPFHLEDKGLALALHARHVEDEKAHNILTAARKILEKYQKAAKTQTPLQILGGDKFLEVAPEQADKGWAVTYLLAKNPTPNALLVYVGDDDKDERAFEVIQRLGGIAIQVSDTPGDSIADCQLKSPDHVRGWLKQIILSRHRLR